MEHSISDVGRMAGISSRTLRHYDDIGLLAPARISSNGYRWYDRRQLLRLQRILMLRELRVPLSRIAEILDGGSDERAALRHHRQELIGERDRLQRVIDTVDRTLAALHGDEAANDEDFFIGLADGRDRLRKDLTARFGAVVEEHFAAAEKATADWRRQDYERAAVEGRQVLAAMSSARTRGISPGEDQALDLVAEHHKGVIALWPADAAAYHALGDLILDNPEQQDMVAGVDADLPPWLSEAIKAYAVCRLGYNPGMTSPVPARHALAR